MTKHTAIVKEMAVEIMEEVHLEWCNCDWPNEVLRDGKYFCAACHGAIRCEICDLLLDEGHIDQATISHIDYYVCDKHEYIAIDNVANRYY